MSFLAPRLRLAPRACSPALRPFSSSSCVASTSSPLPDTPAEVASHPPPTADGEEASVQAVDASLESAPLDPEQPRRGGAKGFRAWLAADGARFRRGIKGQTNWLGEIPFPLNPTFRPIAPLADAVKTRVFNAYQHNMAIPNATDAIVVRAISDKFGISLDRVRAVVKLKQLEKSWRDNGKTLQSEMLSGMESYLGVQQPGEKWRGPESAEEGHGHLAQSKTIFEMIDIESGDAPVLLPQVARAAPSLAAAAARQAALDKQKPKTWTVEASRPGRAPLVVTDLSGTKEGAELAKTYNPNKTKRGNRKRVVQSA